MKTSASPIYRQLPFMDYHPPPLFLKENLDLPLLWFWKISTTLFIMFCYEKIDNNFISTLFIEIVFLHFLFFQCINAFFFDCYEIF